MTGDRREDLVALRFDADGSARIVPAGPDPAGPVFEVAPVPFGPPSATGPAATWLYGVGSAPVMVDWRPARLPRWHGPDDVL